jgi:hypothetical protein
MEEERNINTPTPQQPPQPMTQQPKQSKKGLVIVVIVLSILFLSVAGYIVYKEFIQDTDTKTTTEDQNQEEVNTNENTENNTTCEVGDESCAEEEPETEESTTTTFEGEVITAELPEGWNIIEYFDGDGTESLPDSEMTYEGLTALDIVNPENKQVFSLQAVSGIGFIGCPEYAVFDDDNEAYRFEQENTMDGLGEELNTIDYTDTEYSEFELLGVTFRRIDDKYYYDTQEGNNYFEPPCVAGLLTLEGLYFTDEDGNIYESYFYGATEDATSADLPVVDEILESIELV